LLSIFIPINFLEILNDMKRLSLALLIGIMLVITGCPLQTTMPVDEGSYTASSWLEGKWIEQKADGTTSKTYLIKKGDKPGRILVYTITDGKPESKPMPVVLSNVAGKIFISAYTEADDVDEAGYYIYQMQKKSNAAFDLLPVKEHAISTSASSKEITTFLREHVDGDIYEVKDLAHYKKL
jgi:hypothetical protein